MRLNDGAFSMSVNDEPTRVPNAFVKKNMVRYMKLHGQFARCIFTLAVGETPFWPLVSKYAILFF